MSFCAARLVLVKMMVRLAAFGLQDACDQLRLVHGMCAPDVLLDGLDCRHLVTGVAGADMRRLGHVTPRQVQDLARHGGREQHRLAHGRDLRDELLDVGQEAHVEHLVGLVENQDADLRQREDALVGQVDEPARGADDDVDTLLELLDLRFVGLAPVDGQDSGVGLLASGRDVVGDLQAQLAGRAR